MKKVDDERIKNDYDYAFNKSKRFIRYYARFFDINYDDLFSDCIFDFYIIQKPRYKPLNCYRMSKLRYKWLAFNILKRYYNEIPFSQISSNDRFDNNYGYLMKIEPIPYREIGLTYREVLYLKKILAGYENHEITEFSPFIRKNARIKLAKYYNIENYKNRYKHHKEKTSEKKLESLKKVRALGRSEKCGRAKKKVGVYKNDKLIKIFNSASEASLYVTNNKSKLVVATSIHRNTKYNGYSFKYVD